MDRPEYTDGERAARDAQLEQMMLQLQSLTARLYQIERHLGISAPPVLGVAAHAPQQAPSPTAAPQPAPGPAQAPPVPPFPTPMPVFSGPVAPGRYPLEPGSQPVWVTHPPRPISDQAPASMPPVAYPPRRTHGPGLAEEVASLRSLLYSIGTAVRTGAPHAAGSAASPAEATPVPVRPRTVDWESLIGGKWALWVGSVAVFVAAALFLAYAWVYLPPVARVGIGFLAGGVCLAGGYWARDRGEPWFSEGLTGAGLGLLYLSIWAGVQQYGLLNFELAFVLMAATTALGVGLAVHYDAVSLIALATLGGFLTPALLNSTTVRPGSPYPFMCYVTVLNVGIVVVSLFKRWDGIKWLSFIATVLLVTGWALTAAAAVRWPLFIFVSTLFEIFLGAACFYSVIRKESTRDSDVLLLCADSFIYAMAGYAILGNALGAYPGAFAAALSLAFVGLCLVIRTMARDNKALQQASAGLALFFFTIAVPIQLREGWITIAWSVQAAVLLTLGVRLDSPLLRRAGRIVWCLSLVPLAGVLLAGQPRLMVLFVNERALPLLVSALASGWMAVVSRRPVATPASTTSLWSEPIDGQAMYSFCAIGGGAWLIAQETRLGLSWRQWPSAETWETGALFVTAMLWCGYALGTYILGSRLRHVSFRLYSFIVIALAVALPLWASLALSATEWTPFWNLRWLCYVVVSLTLGALGWTIAHAQETVTASEREALGGLPLLVSLLVLWGVTLEVYAGFEKEQLPSPATWQPAALFAIATLWSVYAAMMLLLSFVWRQGRWRVCAYAVGAVAAALLLHTAAGGSSPGWPPLANARFLAFVVVTSMLVMTAIVMGKRKAELSTSETSLATTVAMLAVVSMLLGLTQETYETCRFYSDTLGPHWDLWAQMAISLVWTVCGGGMLIGGIVRSYPPIRLAALGLLSLTVLKVFLFDLGFLNTPMRIASFGGLGLALIFISWLYSRYGVDRQRVAAAPPLAPAPQPPADAAGE